MPTISDYGINMIFYKNDQTAIGSFTYVATEKALVALKLPSEDNVSFLRRIKAMDSSLVEATNNCILEQVSVEIKSYLRGELKKFTIPIDLTHFSATKFQIKVWEEIIKIGFGKTTTYKEISQALNTKGYQAVGSAVGNNPIPVIVGCHRVLSTEGLGGFSGGINLKKALLNVENMGKKKKISDFF